MSTFLNALGAIGWAVLILKLIDSGKKPPAAVTSSPEFAEKVYNAIVKASQEQGECIICKRPVSRPITSEEIRRMVPESRTDC